MAETQARDRRRKRGGLSAVLRALGVALGISAFFQADNVAHAEPLSSNNYAIDFFQGPSLAPQRVIGLGGAFAGYAEGIDAIEANVAAAAVREPYSFTWFDYDLSAGISFPAAFRSTDFDNDGKEGFTYHDFFFYTLGASIKIGAFGLGVIGDFQQYDLTTSNASLPVGVPVVGSASQASATVGRLHLVGGWSFFREGLSVGLGLRLATLTMTKRVDGSNTDVLKMQGASPEIGLLLHPDDQPWRIGATYRMAVDGVAQAGGHLDIDMQGVERAEGLVVPSSVHLPWEVQIGWALQLGPRPLNPAWLDPHVEERLLRQRVAEDREARRRARASELSEIRDPYVLHQRTIALEEEEERLRADEDKLLEHGNDVLLAERKARYANWPRERITVVGDLLISGPSIGAVSLESFFAQQAAPSGKTIVVSPRLGLEAEPIAHWLQARFGTYIEPSRFESVAPRQHFTLGLDLRLGAYSGFGLFGDQVWRVTAAADLSPRYENIGVSLGAWH